MTEAILALAGTEAGRQVALALAVLAAFAHALLGAMQKGRWDPWITRGAIDLAALVGAVPVALFLVPWPEPHMWPIFAGMVAIHAAYKGVQGAAYQRGAYTVVYPVSRGSAPLFAVLAAGLVFGEAFTPGQWAGLVLLLAGIFGLAAWNLRSVTMDRDTLIPALGLAVTSGAFIALYTTYDAWGIRQTADPFTFLAWFFILDNLMLPALNLRRIVRLPGPERRALLAKGALGALVAYVSFGSIMLATRIGNVGEAAVVRETSTVFAALIGWMVLGERTGPRRVALMALIAAGAV
ncbi:MAG: EamA family transporter, partial [Gemmobacter sp.]